MQTIFCIDDTDNLNSPRGTGELAAMLIEEIETHGWGKGGIIVRHQLFFHPDVPYTSHNSAMSFTLEVFNENHLSEIISFAGKFLADKSEDGSDPGLCAVELDKLNEPELLMIFGKEAKIKVLTKDDAYVLARKLEIHLSEHGGTGQGVIGSLAGVGLRLSGTDGRVRGKHLKDKVNTIVSVGEIYAEASIDLVSNINGQRLDNGELVHLSDKVKSIYKDGRSVLLVCPNEDTHSKAKWQTCPMDYIKSITG